jgi:hypothetical protein
MVFFFENNHDNKPVCLLVEQKELRIHLRSRHMLLCAFVLEACYLQILTLKVFDFVIDFLLNLFF